jgi:hypothetical protein
MLLYLDKKELLFYGLIPVKLKFMIFIYIIYAWARESIISL